MHKVLPAITMIGLFALLVSCGSSGDKNGVSQDEGALSDVFSSSAAIETNTDSTHKFIRTANLKFKVKSVIKSTYDIEDITSRQGGFVTYTNLTSNINNVSTTAVSEDSSLETTYYVVTNAIILRVPNTKLDTVLKELSKNIDYLDYRIIKADDVILQMLSNNLIQKRSSNNEERVKKAIDNKGKKLKETTVAEEVLLNKQEQADNAKISNLSLNDQINFSTISLSIYQREAVKRELIVNFKNIEAYELNFGSKIMEALKAGWLIIAEIILFLIKIWGVLLFIIVGWFLYNRFGQKLKK